MTTLTVKLGERSYPIHIGAGILTQLGDFLQRAGLRGKIAIVTNPMVAELYLGLIIDALARAGLESICVSVPDGEQYKNLDSLALIYDQLIAGRLERNSSVIALGGGVVGDLAGFAAATYLRGVPYIQVPTTLLAQVDSSVGGKTGVNRQDGKNLIGAFYQPRLVVIDVEVLRTLPRRELIAGMAEVIKYGIIEDAELFRLLEDDIERLLDLEVELLIQVIAACCAIKARVVELDERENDYRAVLNFGHTLGHALEAATSYREFLHGEAVAVGIAKATTLSLHQGFCDERTLERVIALLQRAGLPTDFPAGIPAKRLVQTLEVDKKSAAGKIKFVMCAGLGKSRFHALSPAEILAAVAN